MLLTGRSSEIGLILLTTHVARGTAGPGFVLLVDHPVAGFCWLQLFPVLLTAYCSLVLIDHSNDSMNRSKISPDAGSFRISFTRPSGIRSLLITMLPSNSCVA